VLFAQVQTPVGSTAERTQQTVDAMREYLLTEESDVVRSVFTVTGFNFAGRGQNSALAFIGLKPWSERPDAEQSVFALAQRAQQPCFSCRDGQLFACAPPAVMGLGGAPAFRFFVRGRAGVGHDALRAARRRFVGLAAQGPG